jgi:hypothetical protein
MSDASQFPTPIAPAPMETTLALATQNAVRILEDRDSCARAGGKAMAHGKHDGPWRLPVDPQAAPGT